MHFNIEPLDTLFFRDGTPFNAGETQFLDSVFPPTPRSIQGFLRTAILESVYDSWDNYYEDCRDGKDSRSAYKEKGDVVGLIGDSTGLGKLQVGSPYLVVNPGVFGEHIKDKRDDKSPGIDWLNTYAANGDTTRIVLYPAPIDLLYKVDKGRIDDVKRYIIEKGVPSDIGDIPFAYFDCDDIKKYRSGGWISAESLDGYLRGDISKGSLQILTDDILYVNEPRVGIGRDNSTCAVEEGLLYSINQVRLRPGVSIGFSAGIYDKNGKYDNSGDDLLDKAVGVRKFGGEGKLVTLYKGNDFADIALPDDGDEYFRLVFLSPADFGGSWLPKSAQDKKYDNGWPVSCNCTGKPVSFRIISACTGKAVGVGSRTIDKYPKAAIRQCLPAGSVYYCKKDEKEEDWEYSDLNGKCLGINNEMGFGQVVVGKWKGVLEDE